MKKTYLQPMTKELCYSTDSMIAVSGNFTEGETIKEGVYDTPIEGNNAWSRLWGEEDE